MIRQKMEVDTKLLEDMVDEYLPYDIPPTPLRSSQSQRLSLKSDVCSLLQLNELQEDLSLGVKGFQDYCDRMLTPEQSDRLKKELEYLGKAMAATPPTGAGNDIASLYEVSKDLLSSLAEAGNYYYQDAQFPISTGIYTILSMLQHSNAQHFCYRGLSCQAQLRYSDALASFDWAFQLSNSPGVNLLISDCLLECGDKNAAWEACNKAQALIKQDPELQEKWKEYADSIKNELF